MSFHEAPASATWFDQVQLRVGSLGRLSVSPSKIRQNTTTMPAPAQSN